MTEYPVQCFDNNGEPYGRYFPDILNYFHGLTCVEYGHITEAIKACNKSESCVCKVIEANIFPFPSGTIGKTYERDEVEVWYQAKGTGFGNVLNEWGDIGDIDADQLKGWENAGYQLRQIFRLIPQPVEKEPDTVDNELYFEVAGIAQENIIIQNPDKFKHPRLKQPWNEKAKKKYHDQVQLDVLQFIRDLKEKGYVITKQEASR